jgi:hypothetical protein
MTRTALVAVLLTLPLPVLAQPQTGSISGEISDQDGLPLADVQVVVRSPTQIGGDKVLSTDANGRFRFLNLTPGIFELRASKTGLSPIAKTGLRVQAGRTMELFEIMTVPTAREEIVVVAPPPVVDVESAEVGETISDDLLQDVPVQSRGYQGAAAFAPGVSDGGNPNVRGGASYNNTYTVDGITITDPVTHTFGTNFNFDAISDVEVLTAGYGPEYSTTTGGVVNVVTRSGSNDLHLDASAYYQDDALSVNRSDVRGQEFRNLNANLNVDGPIVHDRLWYFASLQLDDRVSSIPFQAGLPVHPERRFFGPEYLAKLNWQVASPTQVVLQWQGSQASIDNTRQLPTVLPEAERHQDQRSNYLSGEVRQSFGPNLLWRTQLVFGSQVLDVYPQSNDFETPGFAPDVATGIESGNDRTLVHDRRETYALNSDVSHFLGRGFGTHALRYGLKYSHAENPSSERTPGDTTYQTRDGDPFRRTLWCVEYDEVTDTCTPGGLEVETSGDQLLLFLQDGWSPRFYDRITLTPGVGVQYGRTENYAGETVSEFTTATPHLNATWTPSRDNKTVLRAGYNQYVDLGFLALASIAGKSLFQHRCDYDPDSPLPEEERYTQDCVTFGGEEGATVGLPRGANGDDLTNPDALTVPRVHELHAGVERELLARLGIGTDFVYRAYTHQYEDIETNLVWNDAGTFVTGYRDGEPHVVFDLETPASARRTNFTWTVFARRSGPRLNLLGSYTYQRSRGTIPERTEGGSEFFASSYLDNPVQAHYFYGPLSDERTHTIKLVGSYQILEPLSAGTAITYWTGAPYDHYYLNPFYGSFTDRRAQRGQDPHDVTNPDDDTDLRLPGQLQVDVKLVWSFAPMIHQDLEAILEIFNLFNLDAATKIEDRELAAGAPTQFGDPTRRQDPLRARLGVRYRY